jgi:hypothetical protein
VVENFREKDSPPVVKRLPFLLVILGLTLGGCALQPANPSLDRTVGIGNAREFDAYASRRTEDLLRMGATKDRSEAEFQAQIDAESRYGPRTGGDTTSWSWTTARENRDLTQSDIDDALAKAAQGDTKR